MNAHLFAAVVDALLKFNARKATKFISPTETLKVTRRGKIRRSDRQVHLIVTFGTPNFAEREFIKAARKAGEKFPIRKVQLKHYPAAEKKPARSRSRSRRRRNRR